MPEAAGQDGYAWRRMHPITPFLKGWRLVFALLVVGATQFADNAGRSGRAIGGHGLLLAFGFFGVFAVLAVAWSYVSWRVTRYAVTDEAVHLRQGIVFRQQRQARLDRLQAIDVVQPLLARLVGLSELRLEVAGGSGARVSLAFLREAEADALRAELLALAAGLHRPGPGTTNGHAGAPTYGTAAGQAFQPSAPGAPAAAAGQSAFQPAPFAVPGAVDPDCTPVPPPPVGTHGADSAVSDDAAISYGAPSSYDPTGTGAVPTYAGASSPPMTYGAVGSRSAVSQPVFATAPEHLVYELPMPRLLGSLIRSAGTFWAVVFIVTIAVMITLGASFAAIYSLVPMAFALGTFFWQRINGAATFRAATSPDGIRLRHGLTETRSQTLPPGRVQAVRLHQPLLWRGKDWWRVEVNVAGYAGDRDRRGNETVLHPVATRDEALLALWLVLPDLGVDDPAAAIGAGLKGFGGDGGFTSAPRRSRWVDPVGWRRHGVLVTRRALLLRSGRFWRQLDVVPHERTQSLALEQGPLQRKLGIASVAAHSTRGPVVPRIEHLDTAVAVALLEEQAERARHARRTAVPEQWMRTNG
jgi:putative membrane protein